jgi:osmotically-inducible protein OsmY
MSFPTPSRHRAALAAALAAASLLGACAPIIIGGAAVGSAMVVSDRRTAGAQVEDQSIELKAGSSVGALMGDRAHINITSYNQVVLLTGEVPTEADKAAVEKNVDQIEHVRSVVNDLAVMPNSSFSARSNDTYITGKVKATFIDASDLSANTIKVVTERGVVFLMGRVTEAEAKRAVELTRNVPGVQKVVRVFEILTPAEVTAIQHNVPAQAPAAASAPAKP